jgi:hypothetical protein
MSTDTVDVQEEVAQEKAIEQPLEQPEQVDAPVEEQAKEERVPLSALQKERRKRQEVEQELKWHKEQAQAKQAPPEPDESQFEAATKADLGKSQQQIVRSVEERLWIKQNPEKAEEVNEKLAEFLKQRPNLASAIEGAQNRYEEAWELIDKLTPKQKAALRPAPMKKDTPGNPAGSPKAAALNQAVDVMQMSDSDFIAWRKSQVKRR